MSEPKQGDKIRFTRDIGSPADEDGPAGFYARRGEIGVVVGYYSTAILWPWVIETGGFEVRVAGDEFEVIS